MRFLAVLFGTLSIVACSQPYGGRSDASNPGYGGGGISPNVVLIDPHTESVYVVKSAAGHVASPSTGLRPTLEHGCDGAVFDAGIDDFDASLGDDVPDAGPKHNEVWRIDPDTGAALHVSDFNDTDYTTVFFPESRLLYDIARPDGIELRLQDQNTLAITARQPVDLQLTYFWDTVSPSERYLVSTGIGPTARRCPRRSLQCDSSTTRRHSITRSARDALFRRNAHLAPSR